MVCLAHCRQELQQRLFLQDRDQDEDQMFKTKTRTFIFVLEAPRDQDPGLEDYVTVCKHGLFCRPVSARLSVTLVYCTAENIAKLLSRPGSPIILVFDPGADVLQFQGDSLQLRRKI